ncbi:MAG TPA: hypothetical protein VIJ75_04415 [Hanamia sp.]
MKKVLSLFLTFTLFATSFAASSYSYLPKKATEIYIPVGNNNQISLLEVSKMKIQDYEKLSGKHLNFFDKITFKAGQKKLKNSIAADGTITNKRLIKAMYGADHSRGFHLGGFALGFFVGLIGVLIAYMIRGDEEVDRNRRKWAWIGFGVYVVLLLAVVIAVTSLNPRIY